MKTVLFSSYLKPTKFAGNILAINYMGATRRPSRFRKAQKSHKINDNLGLFQTHTCVRGIFCYPATKVLKKICTIENCPYLCSPVQREVLWRLAEFFCKPSEKEARFLFLGAAKNSANFQGKFAEIAQLVEHDLAKVGVASSSLVFRSKRQPFGCLFSFIFPIRVCSMAYFWIFERIFK